jgi:Flp pilus assembly protein protease CpaA
MIAGCAIAAVIDARARRIPNWLTLPLIASGLLLSMTGAGLLSPGQAWLGLAVGFTLTFVMFLLRAMGGGDVKLLAGVGAWMGPVGVLKVFMVAAIIGMLIVIVQSARKGRLSGVLRRSALVTINVMHADVAGVENVLDEARKSEASYHETHLPYAVPTLIALFLVVLI